MKVNPCNAHGDLCSRVVADWVRWMLSPVKRGGRVFVHPMVGECTIDARDREAAGR